MRIRLLVVAAALAVVIGDASAVVAAGRSPTLDRFVARFNPQTTTTFYVATGGDPDGGKVRYRWSLKADCGFLTDKDTTGPTNGYQFGPPARQPDGCTTAEEQSAVLTLRVIDKEGCAIVYTQAARNETEHIKPAVRAEPCPPVARGSTPSPPSGGLPIAWILALAVAAGLFAMVMKLRSSGALTQLRGEFARRRERIEEPAEDDESGAETWLRSAPPPRTPPQPTGPLPTSASGVPLVGGIDPEGVTVTTSIPPLLPADGGCEDGTIREVGNDFVAHDTLLAGVVRAGVVGTDRSVEVATSDGHEVLALADALGMATTVEVEVEIPLRLVTVVSTRREICRDGRWTLDVQSVTHDGPERVERLRAIVSAPDELQRFADQILSRRLRSLNDARRRLESALASMRGEGS